MNTEELRDYAEETLHFDAHEFDGLREVLEKEAEGLFGHVDQFVRNNPLICIGIATAAGFAIAATIGSKCCKSRES
jgi:ElaB/YqjD/DUF883 family membrane-anchored ribosome-binding protein